MKTVVFWSWIGLICWLSVACSGRQSAGGEANVDLPVIKERGELVGANRWDFNMSWHSSSCSRWD